MKYLRHAMALAALSLLPGMPVRASNLPDFDPGIAALASSQIRQLEDVPFDGKFRHYRGYLSETADDSFRRAYSRAFKSSISNAILKRDPWMLPLYGVMGPAEFLELGNSHYIWASSCRPHDCPDANVYLVFDPEHDICWGAVRSDSIVTLFGAPTAQQEALLLALIARHVMAFDAALPLEPSEMKKVKTLIRQSSGNIAALFYGHR